MKLYDWQACAERALEDWASGPTATAAPPGMRAIHVPAELPEEYVTLLERAAREMADDLAQGLDTVAMGLKRAKLAGRK